MNNNVIGIIGSLTLIFCCITLGQLVLFLSSHSNLQYPDFKEATHYQHIHYNEFFRSEKEETIFSDDVSKADTEMKFFSMLWDIALICIFALQHSLQANENVKKFLLEKNLHVLERLLYNSGSCLTLQILMYFWEPISSQTLWAISTHDSSLMWWLFSIVHFLSWLTIYSGCLIMDISELLGLKQVYHHILNWPHPFCQKSEGLLRFYSHMRHPGFSALSIILFFHPVMQFDRLLLAQGLFIYMIIGYKVDDVDYAYQRRMLQRKYRNLNALS